MLKGEIIAAAARGCLGVPFQDHGRSKEAGFDCLGLVIHCLSEAGCECPDQEYVLGPYVDLWPRLMAVLPFLLTSVPVDAPWLPGDVLAIRYSTMYNHLGIFVGERAGTPFMVHALKSGRIRHVVESPLSGSEIKRVQSVWRLV